MIAPCLLRALYTHAPTQVKRVEEDWQRTFPRMLAACSLVPPPPPAEAPFLKILDHRGMSNKAFFDKLDRDGDGVVSKVEFRQTMRDLGLTKEELGSKEIDALFSELDVSRLLLCLALAALLSSCCSALLPCSAAPPRLSRSPPRAPPTSRTGGWLG